MNKQEFYITTQEANFLDLLAYKSKMDCWFSLTDDLTAVYDCEEDTIISLEEGVGMLFEGMTDLSDYGLEQYSSILQGLIDRLNFTK